MAGPDTWRKLSESISYRVMNPVSTLVFIRALAATLLLKVLWQWPLQAELLSVHQLAIPRGPAYRFLLYPARLANSHPHLFFSASVLFLIIHLVSPRNVLTALMFCLLAFNLLIINVPTGNGGDLIAFMLSVWAIFLVPPGTTASPYVALVRTTAYNVARISCMLQFVFLYAASGIDKLKSNVWTSASALEALRVTGGIVNPDFPAVLTSPFGNFVLTWSVIGLEVLFGFLIWFRTWQPTLILSAAIFHLGIWWMLDLQHFAIIMIVALSIFVRDDQYRKVFKPWLLSK